MANLTITVANIKIAGAAQVSVEQIGEDMTGGVTPVYYDNTTGKYLKADNNDTEAKAKVTGLILLPATLALGYGLYVTSGLIVPGATLVKGTTYVLSNTAGLIMPISDLASGMYSSVIGIARDTAILEIKLYNSGVQL